MNKTIIIGIDGAHYELIDPWIEQGDLPNIAKIKRNGAWADMESVLPPVTSPNWKCFSTGKNPGKLGIFWWENIDWKNKKIYYPVIRKFENGEIWDYINEAGRKIGVIGMPLTYPPKRVNGFLISGGPDAGDRNFTYPPKLEEEIKKGWKSHRPHQMIDVYREKGCNKINETIELHFKMADILGQRYEVDFSVVVIYPVQVLHHLLWECVETRKAWAVIDKHIGAFMEQGYNLIIMSDHGSNKIESTFNINAWLNKEGYLSLTSVPRSFLFLHNLRISQRSLVLLASKLKMLGILKRVVPKNLFQSLPVGSEDTGRKSKTNEIDWETSKAVASGHGLIYLNPENEDNEVLKKEIKQKLEALVDPVSKRKIIEKVYYKEEIYHGKYLAEAPDLIIDQAKGVHIPGGIGQEVFGSPQRWQAENKKFGLFMAYGPDIKPANKINDVSILDLAPTTLHLTGIDVPDDMDGRVLKEIFKEESEPAQKKVKYQKVDVGRKKVKERIKKLKVSGKL